MIIAGVDPGTKKMGVCLVESEHSVVKPILIETITAKDDLDRARRLSEIFQSLSELFRRGRPQAVFVESPFAGKNIQSALALGEARGVVAVAAGQISARMFDLSPATVKKAVTGNGHADKAVVKRMVEAILKTEIPAGEFDASDAAALALVGAWRMSDAKGAML